MTTDYRLAFERDNKRAVKLAADLQAERRALYAERQEHERFARLLAACGWVRDTPTGHPNQTTDGWLDEAGGRGGLCTSTESACAEAAARVAAAGDAREVVRLREALAQLDEHRDSLIRDVMELRPRAESAERDRDRLDRENGDLRERCRRMAEELARAPAGLILCPECNVLLAAKFLDEHRARCLKDRPASVKPERADLCDLDAEIVRAAREWRNAHLALIAYAESRPPHTAESHDHQSGLVRREHAAELRMRAAVEKREAAERATPTNPAKATHDAQEGRGEVPGQPIKANDKRQTEGTDSQP